MKTFLLTLALALSMLTTSAFAADIAIGVSPFLPKDQAEKQYRIIVEFALQSLKPADKAVIYDAYNNRTIGTINIPEDPAYQHIRTRAHMNVEAISALRLFAANSSLNDPQGHAHAVGSIKLPEFLRWIGGLSSPENSEKVDVLIIGSPLYDDPAQTAFSMKDAVIPGDGHLQNSVSQTVFGIDNPTLLKNMRVHIGYPEEFAAHDQHRWHVKRFWTLFIERQAGQLITFTSDLPSLFNRVEQNAEATAHTYTLQETEKLEMIRLAPVELQESESIFERPVEMNALPQESIQNAKDVQIGITWSCNTCDLDLYVRPHASADVLYFNRTQTAEGRYWKDFRNAPTHGFETIDLPHADLRDVLIAINFYSGNSTVPITGEIRLAVGEKTYAAPFEINANSGNGGQGAESIWRSRKSSFPQWRIINPMLMVSTSK